MESAGIRRNSAYALILTRPRLGLLGISLRQSVRDLWPFTDVRLFPLNNLHLH